MKKLNGKSGFTVVESIIVIIMVAMMIGIGGCVYGIIRGGCSASKAINEKGLKGIATEVWEGTNTLPMTTIPLEAK